MPAIDGAWPRTSRPYREPAAAPKPKWASAPAAPSPDFGRCLWPGSIARAIRLGGWSGMRPIRLPASMTPLIAAVARTPLTAPFMRARIMQAGCPTEGRGNTRREAGAPPGSALLGQRAATRAEVHDVPVDPGHLVGGVT
ncbi:hypothetical protein GCM10020001_003360 [Nonomuraea salmonea]